MTNQDQEKDFENEVRRVARAKWPSAQYSGSAILDGKERDGIFETEEAVYFIEATVSKGKEKAKNDTKKIFRSICDHNSKKSLKGAIGWFITKEEPTADQRKEVQEHGKGQVRCLSFSQFLQSLVDVRAYLSTRNNHIFGSVRGFKSDSKTPEVSFVDIGFANSSTSENFSLNDILVRVEKRERFALVGQYGAGKSMALREIFMRLEDRYIRGKTSIFPIYLNLREHSGQKDPVEVLERHARSIGFDPPSSLVRAWRAQLVTLLIDGFDEVASIGVQGSWKKLRDVRMRSLEGVRRLIKESTNIGIVATGRSHYFEDEKELCSALGMAGAHVLNIGEFTEEQIKDFLAKFKGVSYGKALPDWIPARPLLLGYLASRGFLSDLSSQEGMPDAIDGWDYLLGRIYEREEQIETNLDGVTLRRILERSATLARTTEDGLGPISRKDLFSAFNEVCGYEPDEQGVLAIQRLPGLGIYKAEDDSRCFIDKELVEVCNGREFLRFLESPYETISERIWVDVMNESDKPLDPIGCEVSIRNLSKNKDVKGVFLQAAIFLGKRNDLKCVRGDVAMAILNGNIGIGTEIVVSEMMVGSPIIFHEEMNDFSKISFNYCHFKSIIFESGVCADKLPSFSNSLFDGITGRLSVGDLPRAKFHLSCEFGCFDQAETSGAILNTNLSNGQKVLLVTLRKLFVQSLSGRVESALYRGLDIDEQRYVPDVLNLLKKHGIAQEFARGTNIVWLPIRKELSRVRKMLAAPNECKEQMIEEAAQL